MTPDDAPRRDERPLPENEGERGEKKPFLWLHLLRWSWPLLAVAAPALLACFHVASGTQYGRKLMLSPLRLLFSVFESARDYFGGARKGSSDAFWGTLTAGAVVTVVLWIAAVLFAVFLLCENVSARCAKTPEARAKSDFRLALFVPRRLILVLFGVLRVVPFLFLFWFARVTASGLGAGPDALRSVFDPCPVTAAVMGLIEIGLDAAERKVP